MYNNQQFSEEEKKRESSVLNEGCHFPQTRHKVSVANSTGSNTGGGSNGLGQELVINAYDQVDDHDGGWHNFGVNTTYHMRTTCVRPHASRRITFDLYKARSDSRHLEIARGIAKTQSSDVPEDSHEWGCAIVTEAIEDHGPKVVVYLQEAGSGGPIAREINRFTRDEWLKP